MKNAAVNRVTIRGIPAEVFRDTKACAAKQGKTLGQYISEAMINLNAQVTANKHGK